MAAFTLEDKLVVAISSRALFDFEEENEVYETGDLSKYEALQRSRLNVPAKPGVAFGLIRKLLALNTGAQHVEVVILSRSDPISGLRAFSSCREHGLAIERGVFTRGRPPFAYLKPFRASLFLSANPDDVRAALDAGFPAARVLPESAKMPRTNILTKSASLSTAMPCCFLTKPSACFKNRGYPHSLSTKRPRRIRHSRTGL